MIFKTGRWNYWDAFIRQKHPSKLRSQAKAFVEMNHSSMLEMTSWILTDDEPPLTKQLMNDYTTHMFQPLLQSWKSSYEDVSAYGASPLRSRASPGYTALSFVESQHLRRTERSLYHRALPLTRFWDLWIFLKIKNQALETRNSPDGCDFDTSKHNASSPANLSDSATWC